MAVDINMRSAGSVQSAFSNQLFDIMDDTEYRRITAPEDLEAVGRLRQRAFDKHAIYDHKFGSEVVEEIDFDPLTHVFGIYYRGELAATIRIKRVTPQNRECGAIRIFGPLINSMLDQGMTLLDPGRLAIDSEISKAVPGLNIVTTRLAFIAAVHHKVDYLLFACKDSHAGFYRRVFKATQLAGPISTPGMQTRSVLFANSPSENYDLLQRYPIFRFTQTEARLLFDKVEPTMLGNGIHPTARMALKAA